MYNLNEGLIVYLQNSAKVTEVSQLTWLYVGCAVISCFIAYMLGSLNTSIIVSRLVYKDDVRRHGSGNAGLTNMLRTYGKAAAGMTLLGDIMKTVIALLVAGSLFGFGYLGGVSLGGNGDGFIYIAGMFVTIGHIFPCFYRFKGGKGVLATSAMALILTPIPFLILLAIFVLIVSLSKYVSLGSVTVAVLYPVIVNGYFKLRFSAAEHVLPGFIALATILLAILIVWCHRENLKRISNRTERKLSFKKKSDDEK